MSNSSTQNQGFWEPPRPSASEVPPFQDLFNIFLDDVVQELSALINQRPPTEKKAHQIDQPDLAHEDILYALGALNCRRRLFTLRCQGTYADLLIDPRAVHWRDFQMPGTPFVFLSSLLRSRVELNSNMESQMLRRSRGRGGYVLYSCCGGIQSPD
jgi:hypothetical protein